MYLLRHGHAPKVGTESDKDRQLSSQGREEIKAIAGFLKDWDYPEIIIASDAVRTRQSMEHFCQAADCRPLCLVTSDLYNCVSNDIIKVIENCDDRYSHLMIIGHNPGITGVIDILPSMHSDHALELKARDYNPTAKLVLLKANIANWADILKTQWKVDTVFWPEIG